MFHKSTGQLPFNLAWQRQMLEILAEQGSLAPSGDNMQPWKFHIDEQQATIKIVLDPNKDTSPMNSGNHMARVALGAVVENIIQTIAKNKWDNTVEFLAQANGVKIMVSGIKQSPIKLDWSIKYRATNRKLYTAQPLPENMRANLRTATPAWQDIETLWITKKDIIARLAELISEGDRVMFGQAQILKSFIDHISFSKSTTIGLPVSALEMSPIQQLAFRFLPNLPTNWLGILPVATMFARHNRALIESSSGICILLAPDDKAETDILVGQVMQRAWLTLTRQGLSAQPMGALGLLYHISRYSHYQHQDIASSLQRDKIAALMEQLHLLLPSIGHKRPAFFMRFGYSKTMPSEHAGRQNLQELLYN